MENNKYMERVWNGIWTENPLKPMVIVDRWTIGMIAIYAAVWVIDVYVIKNYKQKTAPEVAAEVSPE